MGGYYYTTKQGDMWDYIAWQVYGDYSMVQTLMEANREHLLTYIFSQGIKIWCPYVEEEETSSDEPDWRDSE
jgi:phage tail protein X